MPSGKSCDTLEAESSCVGIAGKDSSFCRRVFKFSSVQVSVLVKVKFLS